jgi:hypothetical protein
MTTAIIIAAYAVSALALTGIGLVLAAAYVVYRIFR